MFFHFLLCFYLLEFHGGHVLAKTEADIRLSFIQKGMECKNDHPLSPEEIVMLEKEKKLPDNKNAKCFLSCVLKKSKMLDSKGMFDVEGSKTMLEKEYAGDQTKLEDSLKLMESCKKVNDETVTDGESGCERAGLLYKCFHENAVQLGMKIR